MQLDETNVISGNYYIKCLVNNRVYPGKALNIHERINQHVFNCNNFLRKKEPIDLLVDWHQYGGKKNFEWGIIRESKSTELPYEIDVKNRFWELKYIYEIYPSQGIETYNKKSDHDRLLFHYMKQIHFIFKWDIKFVQQDIDGLNKGGTKLDLFTLDEEGIPHCWDFHDPNEIPLNGDINTYTKHKNFCDQRGIVFFNTDPNRLKPGYVEPKETHVFNIVIDNFNVKGDSTYPAGWLD
ncbi:MAG: GIY-YIG nuclease family protein [Chloroflexi bacterium]|nr:GIY-YIG nuclease family protein [Chloroflexota bacterium]